MARRLSPLGALGIDGRVLTGLAGMTLAAVIVEFVGAAGRGSAVRASVTCPDG